MLGNKNEEQLNWNGALCQGKINIVRVEFGVRTARPGTMKAHDG